MLTGFAQIFSAMTSRKTFTMVTDRLKVFGFNIGDEFDFLPFNGNLNKGIYFLWIKNTKRYLVMKLKALSLTKPLRVGRRLYQWSQILIVGEFMQRDAILEAAMIV